MSRSYRSTPIIGNAGGNSESTDKKIWHKRFRSYERDSLSKISSDNFDSWLPVLERDVSNIWDMSKDGKHYWSRKSQKSCAEMIVVYRGKTVAEKVSIKMRELHKAMAK